MLYIISMLSEPELVIAESKLDIMFSWYDNSSRSYGVNYEDGVYLDYLICTREEKTFYLKAIRDESPPIKSHPAGRAFF